MPKNLQKNPSRFSNIESMKAADRIYQDLVQDPGYGLKYSQAKTVILAFEQGLKDVGAFIEK